MFSHVRGKTARSFIHKALAHNDHACFLILQMTKKDMFQAPKTTQERSYLRSHLGDLRTQTQT